MLSPLIVGAGTLAYRWNQPDENPEQREILPTRSIIVQFHEKLIVSTRSLRASRSDGFRRTFQGGILSFPSGTEERTYALYDADTNELLGILTVPDSTWNDPVLIQLEQASTFWKPATRTANLSLPQGGRL